MSQIIAEYKFDNILYDLIPEFNEGFTYTYEDVLEGNVTTRTIYSNELPTLMRFGNSDTSGETGDNNKYNSLLEVLYLASSEITYAGLMFHRCVNVSYICPFILTNKNNSLHGIFSGCHSLTQLDVSNFDTSNVIDMSYAFYTNNLIELDLSDWDTSNVTNMNHILYSCQNLKTLNISNWNLNNVDDIGWFVNQCNNLNEIIMNDSDYNSINKIISELPITTNGSKCNFCIGGVDDISKVNIREGWDIMNQYKIAEYKFNNTIYDLIPEFNAEFTDYTYEDIVDGEVTTRTIYSDSLPTMVKFGVMDEANDYSKSLLSILDINTVNITNMKSMFDWCINLREVNTSNWDTSNVTTMEDMFNNCESLAQLNVSNWDTNKVTNIGCMFKNCNNLTELDLSNWDTSNVKYMYDMFNGCSSLESVGDLSNWDTSNVTIMGMMFYDCQSLIELDLSNWDVDNVEYTDYMFYNCQSLTSLDLSNWNTSKVIDMNGMFENCFVLESIGDVSNWNVGNVTNINDIFAYCYKLESLDLSRWNVGNVVDMYEVFYHCHSLKSVGDLSNWNVSKSITTNSLFDNCWELTSVGDLSNWDTKKMIDIGWMFRNCHKLESRAFDSVSNWDVSSVSEMSSVFEGCDNLIHLDLSNWDTSNVTNMQKMFYECHNLITLDISDFDTSKVTTMEDMFHNCYDLTSLDVSKWDTGNVTRMDNLFNSCNILTSLDVSNWNTSKVTNMGCLFGWCLNLTSVGDLSNWDTSNVIYMNYMFCECYNLTSIDVSNFDTSNVIDMSYMFSECKKLTQLDVSNFDTSNVTTMNSMFHYCQSLTTLDVSNWNTSNVTDMEDVFYLCQSLTSLDVSNWNTSNVTNMSVIFDSCESLRSINVRNWDTSNVTDMGWLFEQCYSLETIIGLDTWDVSNVTDMEGIFAEANELTTLNISNWSLNSELYTDYYMFCDNFRLDTIIMNNSDSDSVNRIIYELPTRTTDSMGTLYIAGIDDISQVDTATSESKYWNIVNQYKIAEYKFNSSIDTLFSEVNEGFVYTHTDIDNGDGTITRVVYSDQLPTIIRFEDCEGLLEVNYLDTSELTTLRKTFKNCYNVTSINTTDWDTSKVTSFYEAFEDCNNLTQLDVSNWNTRNVTTMYGMFYKCNSLTSIGDVSNWDTGNVNNMYVMFAKCNKLTTLDASNWDTRNVTDMAGMFEDCNSLTSIGNLSNWDTGNVTNMYAMFLNCDELTTLDVSNFDTSNVTNMSCLFEHCKKLTSLDVSNFNTSNVIEMQYMFEDCQSLTSLDVSNFDTSNVTNMTQMINECYNLTELNISNWYLNSEVDITDMFKDTNVLTNVTTNDLNTTNLIIPQLPDRTGKEAGTLVYYDIDPALLDTETLQAKNWNLSYEPILAKYIFDSNVYANFLPRFNDEYLSVNYEVIDDVKADGRVVRTLKYANNKRPTLIQFGTSNGLYEQRGILSLKDIIYVDLNTTIMSAFDMFANGRNIKRINTRNWNTKNMEDCYCMFYQCRSLISLDVSNFDTSKVDDMMHMFFGCKKLSSIDLSNFDTSNVTNMESMFGNCIDLTSLKVSNFNTSNVTNMRYMFYNCNKLTSLDVSNFNTTNVTDMGYMFQNCNNLTTLDVSNFDTSKVDDMNSMFCNCYNISSINVSNFNTNNVINMNYLFNGCNNLTSLDVSNWDTSNVTTMERTFSYLNSLSTLNISNFSISDSCLMTDIFAMSGEIANIIMNNSDYNSVNKIISKLPTRTSDTIGTLNVAGIDEISQVDITTAQSKYWNVESRIKVVEYKFDNTIADLVPKFNEAFTDYNIVDQVNNNIITRCIYNINNNINVIDNISKAYDNQSVRTPLILDNGNIEFVCSPWDVAKIDLSEYAGKTASISFTIETKAHNWCEFAINTSDVLYETVISQQTGDTIETINYTKTLPISENIILYLEGMNVTLSDILITIDNVNIFPNKLIDEPSLINDDNKNFYCVPPYYENNKLYFTHSWDGLFIDLQDYIGRDINVKFDVFGIKNDSGWTEFQYGSAVNGDRVELIETELYSTTLNESTELQHFDFNLKVYNKYLYFGGMGLSINNLSIEVINNDKIILEKVNLTNIREYYQEPYYKSNGDIYFDRSWDTYSVNVADYIGKTMNVSFQIESFDDGTYGNWLEAYSTGYSDAHICEICTEKRIINVDYNYTIDSELFILQGYCIKMKNIQLIVDGVNLYETLVGFDSFNDDNYYENFKLAKKMDNGELWFAYSQWNVVGYDLSKYINSDITVSFDIIVSNDSWWSEAHAHIIYSDSYSDSKVFGDTLVCEDPAENKIIHFERTYQLNADKEQAVFILEGMGINIKNLSIRAVNSELPSKISFNGATGLLEVLYLDSSNITDASNMFYGCTKLTNIVGIKDWDVQKITSMYMMFTSCTSLTELDLSNWEPSSLTTVYGMFYKCSKLASIKLGKGTTPVLTSTEGMFNSCLELLSIDFGGLNVSNVNNMGGMFSDCRKLKSLNISYWDVSKVTNFGAIFRRCNSLLTLNLSNWNLSSAENVSTMFESCSSLVSLDLSDLVVENVRTLSGLFQSCSSLVTLNLSGWHLEKDVSITNLFNKCDKLMYVIMERSDAFTVNKFITSLPIRSENNKGRINIKYVDDFVDVNIKEAISKYWTVFRNQGCITNIHAGYKSIANKLSHNKKIKNIYLGNSKLM